MLTPNHKSKNKKRNGNKSSLLSSILTLSLLQGFSSRETDFHFCQFLSNFLKYYSSNFLLFYLYNIFAIYFPCNFPLLKSFSFKLSNFFYCLTSALILPLNSATISLAFSKSFSFSYVLFSNTLSTSLLLLFFFYLKVFTSYFLTPFISTSFTSFTFCPSTCSLYYTTISLIIYRPTYQSTSFLTSLSLNIRSFVLNIILSPLFHSSTSFLLLSIYHFISF